MVPKKQVTGKAKTGGKVVGQVVKKVAKVKPPASKGSDKTDTLKKKLLNSLIKHKGIVTDACKETKISRDTHYRWLKEDPAYKVAVEAVDDVALDFVEGKLHRNIELGYETSIIFYLKTKGKRRGYIERGEITGKDGAPLIPDKKPDLSKLTKEELRQMANIDKKLNGQP
jgi:hypothetical protein